jgi:hypothetical protein
MGAQMFEMPPADPLSAAAARSIEMIREEQR